MSIHPVKSTLNYFSSRLSLPKIEFDLAHNQIFELNIDSQTVVLKGLQNGDLHMHICLGLLLFPVRLQGLIELLESNFMGINTGGCSLCFDSLCNAIFIKTQTALGTTPEENWAWLHRLICVSKEWIKVLSTWEEFVPLTNSSGFTYES